MTNNGSLNGRRRVVVTGLGAVTPLGADVESSWDGLVAGRSGAGEITQFDSTDYAVHFACEVKDFDPTEYIDRKQARRMDRFAHLIVAEPDLAAAPQHDPIFDNQPAVYAPSASAFGWGNTHPTEQASDDESDRRPGWPRPPRRCRRRPSRRRRRRRGSPGSAGRCR